MVYQTTATTEQFSSVKTMTVPCPRTIASKRLHQYNAPLRVMQRKSAKSTLPLKTEGFVFEPLFQFSGVFTRFFFFLRLFIENGKRDHFPDKGDDGQTKPDGKPIMEF